MKFSASYETTGAMQDASIHDYYFHVLLRPRIWWNIALLLLLASMFVLVPTYRSWVAIFAATALSIHISIWIKAYFQLRRQARAMLELMEHPQIEITLDDDGISYTSSTGTRRHLWNKIRRITETQDFLFLMSQSLPLVTLPKSAFSGEALSFIREKSWIGPKD